MTSPDRIAADLTAADLTAEDLLALGLDNASATVLLYVIQAHEATADEICAHTQLSAARMSTTITGLVRLGLLDRVRGRRPAVVFVNLDAEAAVQRLRDVAQRQRDEAALRAERATDALLLAARSSSERGRPMYELRPAGSFLDPTYDVLRRGTTAHDEVLQLSEAVAHSWGPSPKCQTRLILVVPPTSAPPGVTPTRRPTTQILSTLTSRMRSLPRHEGISVRLTREPHAELLLLDAARVRVGAGSSHGRVQAWSREAAHVTAAAELFELWWQRAEPHLHVEPRRPVLPPEPEYDVDEWEPDDIA